MTTRAERRKQQREEARSKPGTDGVSRKAMADALDELEEAAGDFRSGRVVTWTALLDQWHTVDYQREATRVNYARVAELKKRGRELETDRIVREYAQTKEELELIEDQMLTFLAEETLEEGGVESLLEGRRFIPNKGIVLALPDALKDRLQGALEMKARTDGHEEPDKTDTVDGAEGLGTA